MTEYLWCSAHHIIFLFNFQKKKIFFKIHPGSLIGFNKITNFTCLKIGLKIQ